MNDLNVFAERAGCVLGFFCADRRVGFLGLINAAKTSARGANSCNCSSRFAITAELRVALGSADVAPASIKPLRAELGNFERPPVS